LLRVPKQEKIDDNPLLEKDVWRQVTKAIEEILPLYDHVNELISLGQAQRVRRYAIQRLDLRNDIHVLDGGVGPGNTSRLVLSEIKPKLLVGLDESVTVMKTARSNLRDADIKAVEFVRGVFEYLPFRDDAFDAIVTSYALRDCLDLPKSVYEYYRVCKSDGQLVIVDVGKPDNPFTRAGSLLYMRLLVPVIAKIAIIGKIRGNPWLVMFQTYVPLPTNRQLLDVVRRRFPKAELREFLLGGIIVIISRKPSSLKRSN
jgi:demethylmenaquinone methyltransferase/2-methoxy-6-polyprenyl-1,4-benzoquinol methylase